ncbi:MAG: sodium:calcium antiporter [Thermoleophilia bacterium]|nr:sodium:calcium antiporter [Thermoleophilia bacterium]
MTFLELIISLVIILVGCEGFINGIEWFGKKRGLGEGTVGSLLAAVGTALPETMVPIIAIVFVAGEASNEVGVGAILGAPFMLATLAMFVTGVSLVIFRLSNGRKINPQVNPRIIGRDLTFFLVFYLAAVIAGLLHYRPLSWVMAVFLWIGYMVYVYVTLRTEGELSGHSRPLYLASSHPPAFPRLRWILLQIAISLGAIIFGAHMFVGAVSEVAIILGVPALVISLLITPVATELPEKFNSVLWLRARKDTLAFGNITGALVFQSAFPVSVGLLLTPWNLNSVSLVSAAMALGSGFLLLLWIKLMRTIHWWMLLLSGSFYAFFVFYALSVSI